MVDDDDICQEKIVTFNVCTLTDEKSRFTEIQKSITEKMKNICGEKKVVHDLIADYESFSSECRKKLADALTNEVSVEMGKNFSFKSKALVIFKAELELVF